MTDAVAAPTGEQGIPSPGSPRPTWPFFIRYRPDDGKESVWWLSKNLHKRKLSLVPDGHGVAPKLEVYFDEKSPAGEDGTKFHKPEFEPMSPLGWES